MNNIESNIQRKESTFFTTLSLFIPDENLVTCVSSVLQEVIKKYSIPEQNIVDIQASRINQKEQKLMSVEIKYCNFDPQELEALDKAEKIRFALKIMGYKDNDIKSISYRKYWDNSDEVVWVARVYDPNYDFDPDESYCERNFISMKQSAIEGALGFAVILEFSQFV